MLLLVEQLWRELETLRRKEWYGEQGRGRCGQRRELGSVGRYVRYRCKACCRLEEVRSGGAWRHGKG